MSRLSKLIKSREIKSWLKSRWLDVDPRISGGWRSLFFNTTFVGATGSHGKTTTTLLLAKILRTRGRTYFRSVVNGPEAIRRNVLRARPWRHRFFVQEISGHRPGKMVQGVEFLRPSVGIVTAVSFDHRKAFGGALDAIAAEKANLVRALPPTGLAVLNGDDPLVAAMGVDCPCRVVYFGRAQTADLRLVAAESVWPGRLRMEVEYHGEKFEVITQLVGAHWAVSVMAALLAALEMGIAKPQCLAAIAATSPHHNRMSVHPAPGGGWYVLDAFKSSFFGIEPSLQFLSTAVAPRRTVLFGTLSDYPGSSKGHYYKAARMALAVADRVIFTGPNAYRVRRLINGEFAGRLFAFDRYAEALEMMGEDTIADEIIYVKAANRADRLGAQIVPRAGSKNATTGAQLESGR